MPDWRKAVCRTDPDAWFPVGKAGLSRRREAEREAAEACGRCPVLDECRTETARREELLPYARWHGVFAGETAAQRIARVKRERARSAEATVAA